MKKCVISHNRGGGGGGQPHSIFVWEGKNIRDQNVRSQAVDLFSL